MPRNFNSAVRVCVQETTWSRGRDLNPRTAVCSRLPKPLGHPGKSNKRYNAVICFSSDLSSCLQCGSSLQYTNKEWFIRYNVVIQKCETRMRPPCELVVKLILPAFRSLIAKTLIEKYGFSQVAAAEKLGTTQAAISHYLYSKRGDKRMSELEAMPTVQSIAEEVAFGIATEKLSPFDAMLKFCELCKDLRSKDIVCDLHKGFISVPEACDLCLEVPK